MKRRIITLQALVSFVKFCVAPMRVWPLSIYCSRYKVLHRNMVWSSKYRVFSNMPTLHAVIEILPDIAAVFAIVLKLLIFKAHDDPLQRLIVEFEEFLEQMSPEENEFFQNYLRKPIYVHLCFMLCCFVESLSFIGMSVLNWGHWLPGTALFPIPSQTSLGWTITFIQHVWTTWLLTCAPHVPCAAAEM